MKMLTMTNAYRNFWSRLRNGLRQCRSRLKGLLPYVIVSKAQFAEIRSENDWLHRRAVEADKRWVDLNALMAHRAQQERGAVIVRQRNKRLNILSTKTGPAGFWVISVE